MRTQQNAVERIAVVAMIVRWVARTMDGLVAEASRPLEGLAQAVPGGASDEMVLNETGDVGHRCQMRVARDVMP